MQLVTENDTPPNLNHFTVVSFPALWAYRESGTLRLCRETHENLLLLAEA